MCPASCRKFTIAEKGRCGKKKEIMCRKKAKHIDDLAKHIDNSVQCYIPVVCGPGGLSPS